MVYILMGVSGAGKSLIGRMLAEELILPFYDADNFHPPINIQKMRSGNPLNDIDRRPWLNSLAEHIQEWTNNGGAVLACSALKKSYRDILTPDSGKVQFIHLTGTKSIIVGRLEEREDHYMPEELLDSQFETLEPPEPANAMIISIDQPPELILNEILKKIYN